MMFKAIKSAALAAGFALAGGAAAQSTTPPVPAPTTKIMAIGTLNPDADVKLARSILPTEVRATAQLYLQGKIDQWYSMRDRNGVVFILNVTDPEAARAMLEALPLGKAHLMTFELTRLGPLGPLRFLVEPDKH